MQDSISHCEITDPHKAESAVCRCKRLVGQCVGIYFVINMGCCMLEGIRLRDSTVDTFIENVPIHTECFPDASFLKGACYDGYVKRDYFHKHTNTHYIHFSAYKYLTPDQEKLIIQSLVDQNFEQIEREDEPKDWKIFSQSEVVNIEILMNAKIENYSHFYGGCRFMFFKTRDGRCLMVIEGDEA